MQPLIIEAGRVMEDAIAGILLVRHIIQPSGDLPNVRTGLPLDGPIGITNHNTGNRDAGADAIAHARWLQTVENDDQQFIGAHFFVDPTTIVQTLPLDEVSWHAGDGHGSGNRATISIEICEVEPYDAAEANAVLLNAALLATFPGLQLYTHQDWSGKFCPERILARGAWDAFVEAIHAALITPQATTSFNQTADAWAAEAADWAKAQGLLVGRGQAQDAWQEAVSRQELAVVLQRFAKAFLHA